MTLLPHDRKKVWIFAGIYVVTLTVSLLIIVYYLRTANILQSHVFRLQAKEVDLKKNLSTTQNQRTTLENKYVDLLNQDQYKINQTLISEINNIHIAYKKAATTYEDLVELKLKIKKTEVLDTTFAKALSYLSDKNYASAEATLTKLVKDIVLENKKITTSFVIPANVTSNNSPPASGYSRQKVTTDIGEFLVDIISGDLSSTKVIVDTASDSTCKDNCPVLSLSNFVSRSGGFAGINGPYFCPSSYPSCAGKTNSFDTLLMNKNKTYFNSDNNIYSSVPAVIFTGSSARFVGRSSDWGRDTGVDSVIASQPLLLSGGNIVYGGDSEVKRAGQGSRSFIGTKGSNVFIGIVHNANVAQVARVLKALGLDYALNLDSGGSTALMHGGKYIAGPGRDTPFGIVLQKK